MKNTGNGTLIVNNCSFNNNYGIYLDYSQNITISNNIVSSNYDHGIYLFSSSSNRIHNNTFNYNRKRYVDDSSGIALFFGSSYNIISNNTISFNYENGITLDWLNINNTISNNTIKLNEGHGIHLIYASNTTISDNIIDSNGRSGIRINGGLNNFINNNEFKKCGITLIGDVQPLYSAKIDESNTVNNKKIYLYANKTGLELRDIVDVGQIILINCNDTKISNITISETSIGISLHYCENYTIFNNTINFNTVYGIFSTLSEYSNITENFFIGNKDSGVLLDFCDNNLIFNNTFNNNGNGIYIYPTSKNNTIINNILNYNEEYGIYIFLHGLDINSYNNFSENIMKGCGLGLYGPPQTTLAQWLNIDNTNFVNGKPLYCYINKNGLQPSNFINAGQVILVNCNDSIISDLNFSQISDGIYLYSCYNNTIFNNTFSFNTVNGIYLLWSENNNFSQNILNNNGGSGIYLNWADKNNITSNAMENNGEGGINLNRANDNNFRLNNLLNNNESGIILDEDNYNNVFTENVIRNNGIYGVFCEDSDNNLFYLNYFVNNGLNARDEEGYNNKWNNSIIGNYWDDYIELTGAVDANGDGIGDDVYNIYDWKGAYVINDSLPIFENPFHDGSPIHIDDDDINAHDWAWTALMKYWCTGSGTYNDPYIIKDLIINGQNSSSCINIEDSNAYFRIENCTVYNASNSNYDAGIKLENVYNGTLIDNNCSYSNKYGIYLIFSDNNTLIGNVVNNNGDDGIRLEDCNNNTILGSTINYNTKNGIVLFNSHYNNISDNKNTLSYNGICGLYLESSDYNNITTNIINNNQIGIHLNYSDNNYIVGNYFSGNVQSIIEEENCNGNTIRDNFFDTAGTIGGGDGDGDGKKKKAEEAIPGYNIIILIGALCVISVVLIKRRRK